MKSYSTDLKQYETPSAEQCVAASYQISNILLHDVILMEARAFAFKFCAKRRREDNRIKDTLKHKIDEIEDLLN